MDLGAGYHRFPHNPCGIAGMAQTLYQGAGAGLSVGKLGLGFSHAMPIATLRGRMYEARETQLDLWAGSAGIWGGHVAGLLVPTTSHHCRSL